ncbi:MAG: hypothetical protein INR70_02945 [Parafilimonas terrae]|nr:hypothetical protein [Parafilimonas terrae]
MRTYARFVDGAVLELWPHEAARPAFLNLATGFSRAKRVCRAFQITEIF